MRRHALIFQKIAYGYDVVPVNFEGGEVRPILTLALVKSTKLVGQIERKIFIGVAIQNVAESLFLVCQIVAGGITKIVLIVSGLNDWRETTKPESKVPSAFEVVKALFNMLFVVSYTSKIMHPCAMCIFQTRVREARRKPCLMHS